MKRLLTYLVWLALFLGCSPEDRREPLSGGAIRFVADVSVEASKASGLLSGTVLLSGSRAGLFAGSAQSGGGSSEVVMNNVVGTIGAEGSVSYDPLKYYEAGREYTLLCLLALYGVSVLYGCLRRPFANDQPGGSGGEAGRLSVVLPESDACRRRFNCCGAADFPSCPMPDTGAYLERQWRRCFIERHNADGSGKRYALAGGRKLEGDRDK